jgi:adhesin transport system outer membrane protein
MIRSGAMAVCAGAAVAFGLDALLTSAAMPGSDRVPRLALLGLAHAAGALVSLLLIMRLYRIGFEVLAAFVKQIGDAAHGKFDGRQQPDAQELVPLAQAINVMVDRFGNMVREREERLRSIESEVARDVLSGLASRSACVARISECLRSDASSPGSPAATGLVILRINDLSGLNQRFGWRRTDALLKAVGAMLSTRVLRWRAGGALAARLKGADFAIVLPNADRESMDLWVQELASAAIRLHQDGLTDCQQAYWLGATQSRLHEPVGDILTRCDGALQQSEFMRTPYEYADASMPQAHWTVSKWRDVIDAALAENRVMLTPAAACRRGEAVIHIVAECRLVLTDGAVLDAATVIPHAMRAGCNDVLDLRVVQLALSRLQELPSDLCVPLASHSIARPAFVSRLQILLEDFPQARSRLWLKVDAQGDARRQAAALALSRRLQPLGPRVGIAGLGLDVLPLCSGIDAQLAFIELAPDVFAGLAGAGEKLRSAALRLFATAAARKQVALIAPALDDARDAAMLRPLGIELLTGPLGELALDWPAEQPPASIAAASIGAPEHGPTRAAAAAVGIVLTALFALWAAPSPAAPATVQSPPATSPPVAPPAGDMRAAGPPAGTAEVLPIQPDDAGDAAVLKSTIAGADSISLILEGQEAGNGQQTPMHIGEAVALTLLNNLESRAADEKSRAAHWDKVGAYLQFTPTVTGEEDGGKERSQPASINDANGNRVLNSLHFRRDRSITIQQPIIDLSLVEGIIAARDKESLANIDRRDVREGLAYDTVSAYLGLLQARLAVELASQYKTYLDDLSKRMQSRVDGGGSTPADLDRIRGRAGNAETSRIEALGDYETGLAELIRLTKVQPEELVIPDVLAAPIPATPEYALDLAMQSNPTYLGSQKKIELAADDKRHAYAGLLPKLSFEFSNYYSYNAGGAAEGNPIDGVWPMQRTRNVMLMATWAIGAPPVAAGLADAARERETRLRSLDSHDRIEQAIVSGYATVNAARQRYSVLRKNVMLNERVVSSFEEQFKDGTRSMFELLDAYEQLYNSRLNCMRVAVAKAKATYQIRRQIGDLIPLLVAGDKK